VLSISGARRTFGDVVALDGVDLTVRAGEWVALLGPNGAGKTTLMRAVSGRTALDAGAIEIAGERIDSSARPSVLRRLGVVPQSLALYGMLTARENLDAFAALHGVPRRERAERVAWALEWTGLGAKAEAPVASLSGGMQRRLNLACGVLHGPDVILLDEPTVGIDLASRQRVREMLDALRRDGAALVHSSHEIREIERTVDRVVILDGGRVVASGAPANVIASRMSRDRRVRVVVAGIGSPEAVPAGFELRGDDVRGRIPDVARGLPRLLEALVAAGAEIRDVHVDSPGLEDLIESLASDPVAR
jgi:ABC-2 type transport system ATP-binding protein